MLLMWPRITRTRVREMPELLLIIMVIHRVTEREKKLRFYDGCNLAHFHHFPLFETTIGRSDEETYRIALFFVHFMADILNLNSNELGWLWLAVNYVWSVLRYFFVKNKISTVIKVEYFLQGLINLNFLDL